MTLRVEIALLISILLPSTSVGCEWMLHLSDHSFNRTGPHFQCGNYRWDAVTLKPLPHNGVTPGPLSESQFDQIRRAGLLDKAAKDVPNSPFAVWKGALGGKKIRDVPKGVASDIFNHVTSRPQGVVRKLGVLKWVFLPLIVQAFNEDRAEGGMPQAVANTLNTVPFVDLIRNGSATPHFDRLLSYMRRASERADEKLYSKEIHHTLACRVRFAGNRGSPDYPKHVKEFMDWKRKFSENYNTSLSWPSPSDLECEELARDALSIGKIAARVFLALLGTDSDRLDRSSNTLSKESH